MENHFKYIVTNNKKSWKTISNTLSINYINALMTDGYMILGKIKKNYTNKTRHNKTQPELH
jgi:hypothetical protein